MQHIRLEREDDIVVVTLVRGRANALNEEMVGELQQAFNHAHADPHTRGVILTSASPKMFSAGFDVQEVFFYDTPRMTRFMRAFLRLFDTLRYLPKPVVAALPGHTYAAGAILALVCDVRVMSEGDFGFALSEVNIGVVLPARVIHALASEIPLQTGHALFLEGHVFKAGDALAAGLVDELVPAGNVSFRAATRVRELAHKPPHAFAGHKRALVDLAGGPPYTDDALDQMVAEFMTVWDSDESREARSTLIDRLRA
jgi:enoyl-CoA hydratase/carnithine racemase